MAILLNRRELAMSVVAGGAAGPSAGSSKSCAVVGAGVFGAWTAYHLRRAGHSVTLLDAYGPASSRASSGGETRIIRASYGKDEVYTRMAIRSLALWDEFFAKTNHHLLHRIGVLWLAKPGDVYADESRMTLRKLGVVFEDYSPEDVERRYPQIKAQGTGAIFEPNSGALMAREAVQEVVAQMVKEGGTYRHAAVKPPRGKRHLEEILLGDSQKISAETYVFACGPWLGKLFPEILGHRIFPTRQDVLFFGIPPGDSRFEPPQLPVWIDFSDGRGMYGFPDLATRGFKVAFDLHGPPFDPDSGERLVSKEQIETGRAYIAERFPGLQHAPLVDSRVCQYENTSNGDFVIDRHPEFDNVWVVGGGSGHGFKHGPVVGEYTAARVMGRDDPPVEPRFSLASKSTVQNRAVY
jgi:glycine/D-amino acid oxidase-like deaminating enzyme